LVDHMNSESDEHIITIEDPIEYIHQRKKSLVNQRSVGPHTASFSAALRSALREDPDIIMVGEMRDAETTGIGIEASLTGHLVFATLHTNSAPESIVRLLDMGMDPFNFADALLGILAQRLAKRLCSSCKQAYAPSEAELNLLLTEYCEELLNTEAFLKDAEAGRANVLAGWRQRYADKDGKFSLYRAVGCDECNKGYRGRVGLQGFGVPGPSEEHLGRPRRRWPLIESA